MLLAWRRFVFWCRRAELERELKEELELHASLARNGKEMGNITLAKEESRDMWGFRSLEHLLQDARYAIRVLIKNPAFSAVAILSLALGIAGNTAIFSIVNALLIRPLPFQDPSRLVRITNLHPQALFEYFQQRSKTMDIASVSPGFEINLTGQGPAMRVTASATSANLFSLLGASVEKGRVFSRDEDRPGNDGVVILSHELWREKFHQDPDILGRTITLGGMNRRIVGIAPASFAFPSNKVQLWFPIRIDSRVVTQYWAGAFVPLVARLRPGVALAQAQAEIHSLAANVWKLFPWPMPKRFNADSTLISLQTDLAGETRSKLFILLSAVGVVLVIACANVASLLLARATTRRKEIAMRAALGAGSARIVRQLLTESVVLALTAGICGVLLGATALSLFRSVVPPDIPGVAQIAVDWRVAVFAAALSILTGLAFGVVPALSAGNLNLVDAMKTGSQRSTTDSWIALRTWLIVGEVALTLVLVVGAGLLMKSLYGLTNVNPGFNSQKILTVKISPNQSFCVQREACVAFYNRLLEESRGLSGVMEAAVANTVPLDGQLPQIATEVEDHPRTPDFPAPMLWAGAVTPGYLRLMQIPLVTGRAFTAADGSNAPPVILISTSTAKRFWPNTNPLGKHIRRAGETSWRTIVGVVADVRQFNLANNSPTSIAGAMYMPYAQAVDTNGQIPVGMNLLVKTTANADQAATDIRRVAIGANPDIPVGKASALTQIVGDSISGFRSTIWIFLSFAVAALVLAAIGLYGLMSYSVSQRTYEISVRMATGATGLNILRMILAQSLRTALLGMVVGLAASLALTRFLSGMLFDVTPTDARVLVGVCLFLLAVAVAATSVPAWRAARINPIRTLRAE